MYSHTENIVVVTNTVQAMRNGEPFTKPVAWAITGTREMDTRGREIGKRAYREAMPCDGSGCRLA